MLDQYAHFLDVSATASAGFTGLLLVALSIVNSDESQHGLRERRMVLAGSAFLALVDIFFVSLLSSLGGAVMLAAASLVMAAIGLLGTSRLMPRAKRAGNFARDFPKRKLNLMFATVAVTLYYGAARSRDRAAERLAEHRADAGADLRPRDALRERPGTRLGSRRDRTTIATQTPDPMRREETAWARAGHD